MFSVIIPLYNKRPYILKAIQSVLMQTWQEFELLVINDGSTDGAETLVTAIADTRLRMINQVNQGVSVARNEGVKLARFPYVAFLDADDWWDPHFLEEMAATIAHCPDAGLYGSSYFVVKNAKNRRADIGVASGFITGYIDYFSVYARTFWVPINCSFVVVRKAVFEKEGGFKPTLKFGEDFDLWLRIALHHRVAYVNKPLAYSNQDVDPVNRALGSGRRWAKQEHVVFNLGYVEKYPQCSAAVLYLLEGLKLRLLEEFYLRGQYPAEIKGMLATIDWRRHPVYFYHVYKQPKVLVNAYFTGKKWAYNAKNWLINTGASATI